MFKRKITKDILKWKNSLKIKKRALVIKGLRQIGKTTVVKQFCKENYKSVVYINFMENTSIKKIFDGDLVVDNIIRDLSAALLLDTIDHILNDPKKYKSMVEANKKLGCPDSASKIYEIIRNIIDERT